MSDIPQDGPEGGPIHMTSTEDVPAAPGWLEPEADKVFAKLGLPADKTQRFRDSYIDCLASAPRSEDLDSAHDSCRMGLLSAMKAAFTLDATQWRAFEKDLEALEARLTADL
ncbi:hypothetical protein AA0472_1708 [Acetobacter estunensis NRIC 0472]|uniref:Uncharacterized protein n=1 Tax=Acetobacter estunensis TaxID=104097 RepID=A0A967EHK5_9PROT|nr:hypothetical protein [Acetobacter estunensis]NHO53707.1 hypothetical protein [Acetobacter estunensis]GBQ25286.1 hypothetical protein AA0472_1708 [Acetobacter estunensis NRIC 0472]